MPVDLISIQEAARLLNAPPRTVQAWCKAGRLTARRYGNIWLMERADVLAFTKPEPRGWGIYHERRKES